MTTITDAIASNTRGFEKEVRINGVLMTGRGNVPGIGSMEWGDSYDAPVPVARVELSAPGVVADGHDVTIDAGYSLNQGHDRYVQRVFTGKIIALPGENPDFLRSRAIVTGATVQVGTPPDTTPSQIQAIATLVGANIQPPLPSGTYIDEEVQNYLVWTSARASAMAARFITKNGRNPSAPEGDFNSYPITCAGPLYNAFRTYQLDSRSVASLTDVAAIAQILDYVGITDRVIDTPPDGAYTLATDAALSRARASDMLQKLMELGGLEFHQTPAGITVLRYTDFFPAPSPNFTYTTDTQASARILRTTGELEVPFDPTRVKGETGYFRIPHLNIDGRYFVYGVRHYAPKNGTPVTRFTLWGGNRLGGTVQVNPVASFTFKVVRQAMKDGIYLVYTCDASSSIAGDGSPLTYAWTNNRTTVPAHPLTGKVITFRVPSTVTTPLTETLTVTATNTGLTHSVALDLPTSNTQTAVIIAPFVVAAGTYKMVTPDGGPTWSDVAGTSAAVCAARPADGVNVGHYLIGDADGLLVTRDFGKTWTTVLSGVGSNFTYALWDWRNPLVCWALTDNCKLYISIDGAATFGLYANLRTVTYGGFGGTTAGALGNWLGAPAGGGIYVFGGTGTGFPLIAYDANLTNNWISQAMTGDILTDGAGGATLRIASFVAPGDGMATMILKNCGGRANGSIAIYSTSDPPGPSASYTRATGLDAGLTDGAVILADAPLAGAGVRRALFLSKRDVYNATDGIAYTKTANVLPAGFTPNHGLLESDLYVGSPVVGLQGVYLIAAEDAGGTGAVFKSVDALATVEYFRPIGGVTTAWPAGAKAKMIAIGAPSQTTLLPGTGSLALLTKSASPRTITKLFAASTLWTSLVGVTGITSSDPKIFCPLASIFFATNDDGSSDNVTGDMARSTDAGDTWTASILAKAFGVARASDGRLWAFTRLGSHLGFNQCGIHYSDDNGANWTLSTTIGNGSSQVRRGIRIACHPTNPNIIAVWGSAGASNGFIAATSNRGSSWTITASGVPGEGQVGVTYAFGFAILPNNRFVYSGAKAVASPIPWSIQTSDDSGVTWVERYAEVATNTRLVGMGVGNNGTKIVVMRDVVSPGTQDGRPLVSLDSGNTFALAATDSLQTFLGLSTSGTRATAYDSVSDMLYVAVTANNDATHRVAALTPVSDDGEWSNLTDSIGSGSYGDDNLAVIPA